MLLSPLSCSYGILRFDLVVVLRDTVLCVTKPRSFLFHRAKNLVPFGRGFLLFRGRKLPREGFFPGLKRMKEKERLSWEEIFCFLEEEKLPWKGFFPGHDRSGDMYQIRLLNLVRVPVISI